MKVFSVWWPGGGIFGHVAIRKRFVRLHPLRMCKGLCSRQTETEPHERYLRKRMAEPRHPIDRAHESSVVIQPTVATILAIRAGLWDAHHTISSELLDSVRALPRGDDGQTLKEDVCFVCRPSPARYENCVGWAISSLAPGADRIHKTRRSCVGRWELFNSQLCAETQAPL